VGGRWRGAQASVLSLEQEMASDRKMKMKMKIESMTGKVR